MAEKKHSQDEWDFSFDFTNHMVDLTSPTHLSATSSCGADEVEVGPPVYLDKTKSTALRWVGKYNTIVMVIYIINKLSQL